MTSLSIVGAGWRAEFFLRIAQALPDRFTVRAVVARSAERAAGLRERFGVETVESVDALLRHGAGDFTVVSVPASDAPDVILALTRAGVPVLTETPPASDVDGLCALHAALGDNSPVRVAEQYQFQPHHAARLELARSGVLGSVHYARMSVAHGYHAMSLLRLSLDVDFALPVVRAISHLDPSTRVHGRDDWYDEPAVRPGTNTIATLDFGDRMAVYEFTGEQYLSPIRSRHVTLRGERGEIVDDELSAVRGSRDIVRATIRRDETGRDGDLAGYHLRGLTCDGKRVYINPFAPARLSDDEIAGASLLDEMSAFVLTGNGGYSLADAAQDQYLALLVEEAVASGGPVQGQPQPWAKPD